MVKRVLGWVSAVCTVVGLVAAVAGQNSVGGGLLLAGAVAYFAAVAVREA